jgi:hypothetical protein
MISAHSQEFNELQRSQELNELRSLILSLQHIQSTCDERAVEKQAAKPIVDYINQILYCYDYRT